MAVTGAQEAAFIGATLGVPMSSFNLTILLILYSVLYIWLAWLIVTQWRAWARKKLISTTFYSEPFARYF